MNLSPNPLPLLSFSWVFFVSSTLILQMANTRIRNNNNNNGNNNGENNQDVNPPPPPLPTLKQVLIMQAQMLQTMQQTLVNMQAAQPQALPPPLRDRLKFFDEEFYATRRLGCRSYGVMESSAVLFHRESP
jgi:hypothetical protein